MNCLCSPQVDGNWDFFFFQFRYKKPAASLFPESQGYADMCFCQLFTAVLSFRCRLSWHVELSKRHSVELRLCFPSQVWSFPKEFSGGSIVTGQWTLTSSCAELLGAVNKLTGLLWYPSQWAAPPAPPAPPANYTEKCCRSWRHKLAVAKLWVVCRPLPNLEVGGEGVWIVYLHSFLHRAFPVLFTEINSLLNIVIKSHFLRKLKKKISRRRKKMTYL